MQDDVKKPEIIPAIKTDHSAISLSVNSLKDLDHLIGSLIPAFCITTITSVQLIKSVSMRKPGRTRQEVIQLKSPILLKLGINVGFCE